MDYLGGNGNGLAWYASPDAALTNSPLYTKYSQLSIHEIIAAYMVELKMDMGNAKASAEAAPLLNYLQWIYAAAQAVA